MYVLLCVNTCEVLGLLTLAQGQSRTEEEVGQGEAHLFSLAPRPCPIPGTDTWGKWETHPQTRALLSLVVTDPACGDTESVSF